MKLILSILIIAFFSSCAVNTKAEEKAKKVILLSGPKSHAFGHHECNSDISVLENLLQRQTKAKFTTKLFLNGAWPETSELEAADAIVVCCDGDQKHILKNRMAEFDALLNKNSDVGLLFIHYATVPNGRTGTYFNKWIGGFYAGQKRSKTLTNYSHIKTKLSDHPVNKGVEPYTIFDEIYYRMEYVEGIKPVIVAEHVPDVPKFYSPSEKSRFERDNDQVKEFKTELERTIFWSFEREGGGKSLGVTMGHIHKTFWMTKDVRKQMVNSVAWISGLEIPSEGFEALDLSEEQLNMNHSVLKETKTKKTKKTKK